MRHEAGGGREAVKERKSIESTVNGDDGAFLCEYVHQSRSVKTLSLLRISANMRPYL